MTLAPAIERDFGREQRGGADPSASVWVAASAGTGKTKVLTDRVLNLLLRGTDPERVLCLTYTKAAAAEMNKRIADRLGRWAATEDGALEADLIALLGQRPKEHERRLSRQLFARVLDSAGGIKIQTIHSFCQSLLDRFPIEAGIAPNFTVMDERDQDDLLATAQVSIFERSRDQDRSLANAMAVLSRLLNQDQFDQVIQKLIKDHARLSRMLAGHGSLAGAISAVRDHLDVRACETAYGIIADACRQNAFDAGGLRDAVGAIVDTAPSEKQTGRGDVMACWLAASESERGQLFHDYIDCFLKKKLPRHPLKDMIVKAGKAKMPEAETILHREAERLLAILDRCCAVDTAEATSALLTFGDAVLRQYRRLKAARSWLDFDDLIERAAALLEADGGASWALYKLDGGIDHILIDEAQDTSPAQWRIVRALTSEFFSGDSGNERHRTVFAVGDVKQSIFSFQGADPDAFVANREYFGEKVKGAEKNWRPIDLSWSFRSTRAVLAAVDAVFRRDEARDGVALDRQQIVHQAYRMHAGGLVEVWPLVTARPAAPPEPWEPPIKRVGDTSPPLRLARLIANRIKKLTDGTEMLESHGRPVRPGDIMVLVRRRNAFLEELVRHLKLAQVDVAGVDRMILTDQIAVMDLIAAGRFALFPTDSLNMAALLKGPLIGWTEEELFDLAHGRQSSLWAALAARGESEPHCRAALTLLRALLAEADQGPPFRFYATLLGPLGGRARLLERLGREAEEPIAEFLDLTIAFEHHHIPSLQVFLHWLEAGSAEVKRDTEQSELDAVRVMTVHGAKGLQAPVVFLPDTTAEPALHETLLWPKTDGGAEILLWSPSTASEESRTAAEKAKVKAKQLEEYRRLLYVAMTRAEDRLVVCGWRPGKALPDGCWYNLVRRGLESAPDMGVIEVEDAFLHRSDETEGSTVLRLHCAQDGPAKSERRGSEEVEPGDVPSWARQLPPETLVPERPLVPSRPEQDEPPPRSPLGPDHGVRFARGRLIHRLLQFLPDLAAEKREAAAASWLARPVHALSAEAQRQIAEEVLQVLSDPEFGAVFGPGSRAEVPITGLIGDRAISGRIDRILITENNVDILDFKTDRPPPAKADDVAPVYLKQMAAYRSAIRLIYPNRPVRCALAWTDTPALMPLADDLLDRHTP